MSDKYKSQCLETLKTHIKQEIKQDFDDIILQDYEELSFDFKLEIKNKLIIAQTNDTFTIEITNAKLENGEMYHSAQDYKNAQEKHAKDELNKKENLDYLANVVSRKEFKTFNAASAEDLKVNKEISRIFYEYVCPICKGEKTKCDECKNGNIKCDKCLGVGEFDCDVCDKKGEIKCDECRGKGEMKCNACRGGRVKCEFCRGNGEVKCEFCRGKGEVKCNECKNGEIVCDRCVGGKIRKTRRENGRERVYYEKCQKCKGYGSYPCKRCGGEGFLICGECDGEGEFVCDKCNGNGEFVCAKCGGKEFYACLKCRGKGVLNCSKCDGKSVYVCAKCSGEKVVKCPKCRGTGLVYCSTCNLKGKITKCTIFAITNEVKFDTIYPNADTKHYNTLKNIVEKTNKAYENVADFVREPLQIIDADKLVIDNYAFSMPLAKFSFKINDKIFSWLLACKNNQIIEGSVDEVLNEIKNTMQRRKNAKKALISLFLCAFVGFMVFYFISKDDKKQENSQTSQNFATQNPMAQPKTAKNPAETFTKPQTTPPAEPPAEPQTVTPSAEMQAQIQGESVASADYEQKFGKRIYLATKDDFVNMRKAPNGEIITQIYKKDFADIMVFSFDTNSNAKWLKVAYFPPNVKEEQNAISGYIHISQIDKSRF